MKLLDGIETLWYNSKYELEQGYLRYKYPDYVDNEYNCGSVKFIWGIVSSDEMCTSKANLYSMNDIDLCYDRDTKKYMVGIEIIYQFKNIDSEIHYYQRLLDVFTKYMIENNYRTAGSIYACANIKMYSQISGESIEDVYSIFKIYMLGYIKELTERKEKWENEISKLD